MCYGGHVDQNTQKLIYHLGGLSLEVPHFCESNVIYARNQDKSGHPIVYIILTCATSCACKVGGRRGT